MQQPTITLFSNFLNHHQIPFCEEMVKLIGNHFKFVATEPIDEERIKLGYQDYAKGISYALNSWESKENHQEAIRLANESDVVIFGSAPEEWFIKRIKNDQLTFRYSERFLKKGLLRLMDPRLWIHRIQTDTIHRNRNFHLLCTGAYAAFDYALFGSFPGKMYRWGYFPKFMKYELIPPMIKPQDKVNLLWAGRFIGWKRPAMIVRLMKKLIQFHEDIHLDMIGTGPRLKQVERLVEKKKLKEHVTLHGALSPQEVREYMEQAHIFVSTSNKEEGWGAVINEAMNSGCAVYAYYKIGAAPTLIQNNHNGILYVDEHDLFVKLNQRINNPSILYNLGRNAYWTIEKQWNASIAAGRFLEAANALLEGRSFEFESGPMSKAKIIIPKIHD